MMKDISKLRVFAIVGADTQVFWTTPKGKYLWTSRRAASNAWTFHMEPTYEQRRRGIVTPKPEDYGLKVMELDTNL